MSMPGPFIAMTVTLNCLEEMGYCVIADRDADGIRITAVDNRTGETFTVTGEPGNPPPPEPSRRPTRNQISYQSVIAQWVAIAMSRHVWRFREMDNTDYPEMKTVL